MYRIILLLPCPLSITLGSRLQTSRCVDSDLVQTSWEGAPANTSYGSLKAFSTLLLALDTNRGLHSFSLRPCTTGSQRHDRNPSNNRYGRKRKLGLGGRPRAVIYAFASPSPPPTPDGNGFESFVGFLFNAAGETAKVAAKVASEAAEEWNSADWQLKKRSGSIIPDIQPREAKSSEVLLSSSEAAPVQVIEDVTEVPIGSDLTLAVSEQSSAILSSEGALQLQNEFYSFLVPRDGSLYSTTEDGEIIFKSREDLAALVTEFSYAKLEKLAAASRALSRYVEDLEMELEEADVSTVQLRRDLKTSNDKLSELAAENNALQEQSTTLDSKLSLAEQELTSQEAALAEAERAAERRVLDSMKDQKASQEESMEAAIKLEQDLVSAEGAIQNLAASKEELETQIAALTEKQQQAEAEQRMEAERARKLEREAEEAEKKAEATVDTLAASERTVAELKAELAQLQGALRTSASQNTAIAKGETEAAQQLIEDIETQLLATTVKDRPGLSRMKKADLIAECEERKVETSGNVPELRARLRIARMRDKCVAEFVERGWSEQESRRALAGAGWDYDAAMKVLTSK